MISIQQKKATGYTYQNYADLLKNIIKVTYIKAHVPLKVEIVKESGHKRILLLAAMGWVLLNNSPYSKVITE